MGVRPFAFAPTSGYDRPMVPDLDKLRDIRREMSDLGDAGKLTRAEFDRLFALAKDAADNDDQYLEGIETVAILYGVQLRAVCM